MYQPLANATKTFVGLVLEERDHDFGDWDLGLGPAHSRVFAARASGTKGETAESLRQ